MESFTNIKDGLSFCCLFCKDSFNPKYCGDPYIVFKGFHICVFCAGEICKFSLNENRYGNSAIIAHEYLKSGSVKKHRRSLKSNKKIFKDLLIKYNFKCHHCSERKPEKLTVDHIKPVSKGGSDEPYNLQILCRVCNSKKGAKWKPL